MTQVAGGFPEADQFLPMLGFAPQTPTELFTVSSTIIELQWAGPDGTADRLIYTPGVSPLTSRLGAQLGAFDLAIPFP